MPLIVQDPLAPVSNANSYLSLVDARALAAQYALILPDDDTEAESALINATLYLNTYEDRVGGERSTDTQSTMYPRKNSHVRCAEVHSDVIPDDIKLAQVIAAEAFGRGDNLWGGADDGRSIASEKVDVIAVSYFDNGATSGAATLPRLDQLMKQFFGGQSQGLSNFSVYRV